MDLDKNYENIARRDHPRVSPPAAKFPREQVTFRSTQVDRAKLNSGLRNKTLHKLRRGQYCFTKQILKDEPWYETALKQKFGELDLQRDRIQPESVVSHLTAAMLWGLPIVERSTDVHISGSFSSHHNIGGQIRHAASIPPTQRALVDGLVVTSLERTVVDCLRMVNPKLGIQLADHALARGMSRELALEINSKIAHRRYRKRASKILELADAGAESPQESLCRYYILAAGLPEPVTQYKVTVDGRTYYLDLAIEQLKLAFEFDGFGKYDDHRTNFDEKIREDRLRRVGWKFLRLTSADLAEPESLIFKLHGFVAESGFRAKRLLDPDLFPLMMRN